MLDTLRRIIQEVNTAPDLDHALDIIVRRVRESVAVDVATVYLLDTEQQQYVLSATEGLRKDAIGNVRIDLDEGLVGVVGRREEPLNLEDAPLHPRYHFISETGRHPTMVFSVCRLFSTAMCLVCWLSGSAINASLPRRKKPFW